MAEKASLKQYLIVDENGKGHLPVRDTPEGPLNHHLMGAAWAALHGGYRGNKYEGPGKEAAIARLKALYKSEGMELPEDGQAASEIADFGLQISEIENRQSAIGNPEGPRFLMMLTEPPATGLIRIPIAVTGKWKGAEREFSIGLDDLNAIRENFAKKPTGEINVDYEHASEVPFGTGGPVLSAGRIVKLDAPEAFDGWGDRESARAGEQKTAGHNVEGRADHSATRSYDHPIRYILWGWYEPTERARKLIAAREYRHISPAIRWGAKDKVTGKTAGTVLTSVALVNKPFLEDMPEIHLCERHGTRAFVSLGQLHVPGPVNQISAAYQQARQDSGFRIQDSGKKPESLSAKEKEMAKTLKLKCLTDEHLEKHGLEPEQKGKIGVFDGEELIGIADGPEGWEAKHGDGEEVAALSESIHDGRINLLEAGRLADAGRLRFSTILQAQEAERKVDAAVRSGKVLPKNRAHALKLALSDAAGFAALVEQARPVLDLRSHGHASGGEQPTAQQALMAEVNAYAKENKCSLSVALSDVTKRNPDLWRQYSEEIVTAVEAAQEEE